MKPLPTGAEMLIKGERVKDRVEYILNKYPQAKGDYRVLDWHYCRLFTGVRISFSDFKKLRACPSFETIHRRYREVCKEKGYAPSQRVQMKRAMREQAHENYYKNRQLDITDYI